jgi:hypothetical protein
MHYSINTEEMKTEIENLGHTVTSMWNIKQYRTKLPLSMFFVELKPGPNEVIFIVVYIKQRKKNSNRPKTKGILLNVQTVKDMGTPKNVAISNRDA